MRVGAGIATLALGLALAGCGTVPRAVQVDQPQGATQKPAVEAKAETPDVEAGKPGMRMHAKMIKALFAHLEKKHPQAAVKLHQLEQRLLGLGRQQLKALKAVRYQARKDKTIDQIRQEVESYFANPDAMIANVTADLDKVQGMTAQDLDATVASLPPVFAEFMSALERMPKAAEHEEDDDDEPEEKAATAPPPAMPATK
ncbi:MAG: hypothetical protein FJZ01_23500 [Candidatus Sericytochromatia bacterium]|nr:hypothetical protein [Candidatus Tanganyikabacteria bacterium]